MDKIESLCNYDEKIFGQKVIGIVFNEKYYVIYGEGKQRSIVREISPSNKKRNHKPKSN